MPALPLLRGPGTVPGHLLPPARWPGRGLPPFPLSIPVAFPPHLAGLGAWEMGTELPHPALPSASPLPCGWWQAPSCWVSAGWEGGYPVPGREEGARHLPLRPSRCLCLRAFGSCLWVRARSCAQTGSSARVTAAAGRSWKIPPLPGPGDAGCPGGPARAQRPSGPSPRPGLRVTGSRCSHRPGPQEQGRRGSFTEKQCPCLRSRASLGLQSLWTPVHRQKLRCVLKETRLVGASSLSRCCRGAKGLGLMDLSSTLPTPGIENKNQSSGDQEQGHCYVPSTALPAQPRGTRVSAGHTTRAWRNWGLTPALSGPWLPPPPTSCFTRSHSLTGRAGSLKSPCHTSASPEMSPSLPSSFGCWLLSCQCCLLLGRTRSVPSLQQAGSWGAAERREGTGTEAMHPRKGSTVQACCGQRGGTQGAEDVFCARRPGQRLVVRAGRTVASSLQMKEPRLRQDSEPPTRRSSRLSGLGAQGLGRPPSLQETEHPR